MIAGSDDKTNNMRSVEIKDTILAFLKFKEQYRLNERLRYHKEVVRIGGVFAFNNASDEEIIDEWLKITEENIKKSESDGEER